MRQRSDLPEPGFSRSEAEPAGAGEAVAAQDWPREALSAQRLRDAEVAQAQATLKRELVRVYAQSCGAYKPKG